MKKDNWIMILFGAAGLLLLWKFLEVFGDQTKSVNQNQLLDAINAANKAAADKAAYDAKLAADKAASDAAKAAAKAASDAVDKAIADAKAGK
jgi:hypothetical protein